MISFFINTTGKRVLQTGRALAGIKAYYMSARALYGIEIYLILVHFIQIVLPFLLYEYKDHSLVARMFISFFFFLPFEFSTISGNFSW